MEKNETLNDKKVGNKEESPPNVILISNNILFYFIQTLSIAPRIIIY